MEDYSRKQDFEFQRKVKNKFPYRCYVYTKIYKIWQKNSSTQLRNSG